MSGDGVCTWQDPAGKRYSGEFHKNKRHGFGTMVWPQGQVYEGLWRNGKRHGLGKVKK